MKFRNWHALLFVVAGRRGNAPGVFGQARDWNVGIADENRRAGRVEIIPLDIHIVSMYSVPMIRKELVAASAEPLILSLLAKGESYGYAIIQEVKLRSEGKLQWTDGMLYPVLHRMERRGLIKARWGESETGRKRKYYSLKKDGKAAMAKHHEQWSLVHSVLAGLKKEQYV
jgi:PadR family transcriptional regulator, regulatory protein PadR